MYRGALTFFANKQKGDDELALATLAAAAAVCHLLVILAGTFALAEETM